MDRPQTVGVIDLGKARFKSYLWGLGGPLWRDSRETGKLVEESDVPAVLDRATSLLTDLHDATVSVFALSGDFLRASCEWRSAMSPLLLEMCDEAIVLSENDEGRLLFEALAPGPDDALLDIGGGSVQLVWHDGSGVQVRSWRLGTFTVQSQYGLYVNKTGWSSYQEAMQSIEAMIATDTPKGLRRLVVGSNLMKDAFAALGRLIGHESTSWSWNDLLTCAKRCSSLDEESFEATFPQNWAWMYGADKAMLVAATFAKVLDVEASGSNASVGDGAGRVLIDQIRVGEYVSLRKQGFGTPI